MGGCIPHPPLDPPPVSSTLVLRLLSNMEYYLDEYQPQRRLLQIGFK